MVMRWVGWIGWIGLVLLLAGCGAPQPPADAEPTGAAAATATMQPTRAATAAPAAAPMLRPTRTAMAPSPTPTPTVIPTPTNAVRAWPRVAMLDAQHIWFVTPPPDQHPRAAPFSIFATTDGGQSWDERTMTNAVIDQLQFVSPQDGFAIMDGTLHTTYDGGATWQPMRLPATSPIVYFSFHTAQEGFVIPERADQSIPSWAVFRTNDGGVSWIEQTIQSPCHRHHAGSRFAFYGLMTGWVVCIGQSAGSSQGRAWYTTTDGGATWTYRSPQPPQDDACQAPEAEQPIRCRTFHMQSGRLTHVTMLDAQHGWFVHHTYETGGLQMTSDGGVTWDYVDIPSEEHATHDPHPSVDFTSRTEGVVAVVDGWLSAGGVDNILYRTTDGGQSWEQIYP